MKTKRAQLQRALLMGTGGLLLAFLALPLIALFVTAAPKDVAAGLSHPLVWPALRLSLFTTACTLILAIVLGTPLAWLIARSNGAAGRAVESFLQLPIVIPPAVAGVALLFAFGRRGLLGSLLDDHGIGISFTTGAVVLAELFVAAPFYVQAAIAAFRRVDEKLITVARSVGASPWRVFVGVGIPVAQPGLFAGAALCWARALGEFGATLMFAGNLEGRTQTLPLAIYTAMEADLRAAQALSMIMVVVALFILLTVKAFSRRAEARA